MSGVRILQRVVSKPLPSGLNDSNFYEEVRTLDTVSLIFPNLTMGHFEIIATIILQNFSVNSESFCVCAIQRVHRIIIKRTDNIAHYIFVTIFSNIC